MKGPSHDWLSFPTQYTVALPETFDIPQGKNRLTAQLSILDLRWRWNFDTNTGIGEAPDNVWKRAYRRLQKKKKDAGENIPMQKDNPNMPVALAFRIQVHENPAKEVIIDWLRGTDVVLWESFCGMVHTSVKQA